MTSTASKSKGYFDLAYRKAFASQLVYYVIALIASVVVTAISVASTMWNYSDLYTTVEKVKDVTDSNIVCLGFVSMIAGAFSLLTACSMFRKIYKKQSCDTYFATPIKREEYFAANFLNGAVSIASIVIVSEAIYYGIVTANGFYVKPMFLVVTLAVILALVAMYSAFIMCAVMAGKKIHYVFLALICLFNPMIFLNGINTIINSVWGFSNSLGTIYNLSSVYNAIYSVSYTNLIPSFVISAVEILVLYVIGRIIFKHREAESAESSLSGNIMPCLLAVLFAGSAYFYFRVGEVLTDVIIGAVVALLSSIAFCLIFYKKPFVSKATISVGVCTAIFVIASIVTVSPLLNSYVKYVPTTDEVESVEISSGSIIASAFDIMVPYDYEDLVEDDSFTIKDSDNIQKVIDLHNDCIKDSAIDKSRKFESMSLVRTLFFDGFYDGEDSKSFVITYNLNNGKKVKRSYTVVDSEIKDTYVKIFQNEEVLDQLQPFTIPVDRYVDAEVNSYNEYNYEYTLIETEAIDYDKLVQAYHQDLLEMSERRFANSSLGSNSSFGLWNFCNYYSEEMMYEIDLYYAHDDVPQDEVANYKNMTVAQKEKFIYDDDKGEVFSLDVYSHNTHVLAYLDSLIK